MKAQQDHQHEQSGSRYGPGIAIHRGLGWLVGGVAGLLLVYLLSYGPVNTLILGGWVPSVWGTWIYPGYEPMRGASPACPIRC